MAVEWLAYTRKDLLFPKRQKYPHRSTEEEIGFLTSVFPDGHAHVLGPLTRDHWFVFVVNRADRAPSECRERTLNIMMYDIDPDVANCFFREGLASVNEEARRLLDEAERNGTEKEDPTLCRALGDIVTKHLHMDELLPGSTTQSWVFDPCGWSLNGQIPFGIVPKPRATPTEDDGGSISSATSLGAPSSSVSVASERKEDEEPPRTDPGASYWTVHITPEQHCSYVSFETNAPLRHYQAILRGVLSLFRPKRFSLTLFADKWGLKDIRSRPHEHGGAILKVLPNLGYARLDLHSSDFVGDYTAVLGNYTLLPEDLVKEGGEIPVPLPWEPIDELADAAAGSASPWEMARLTKALPSLPGRHRASSIS
jgi:S-adenosylmethionine decarboxylase